MKLKVVSVVKQLYQVAILKQIHKPFFNEVQKSRIVY